MNTHARLIIRYTSRTHLEENAEDVKLPECRVRQVCYPAPPYRLNLFLRGHGRGCALPLCRCFQPPVNTGSMVAKHASPLANLAPQRLF